MEGLTVEEFNEKFEQVLVLGTGGEQGLGVFSHVRKTRSEHSRRVRKGLPVQGHGDRQNGGREAIRVSSLRPRAAAGAERNPAAAESQQQVPPARGVPADFRDRESSAAVGGDGPGPGGRSLRLVGVPV